MAAPRSLLPLIAALLATTAPQLAQAQLRGAVGQMPADPNATAAQQAPAAAPQGPMLPTLDDEIRANDARRKAREQARAVTSAGNPVLDPKTRGQYVRPVRASIALRRPANRAVPLRVAPGDPAQLKAGQALPQIIGPGLSDSPAARPAKRPQDEDPFAPTGIRVGGLILRPGLDANIGYDTNPLRAAPNAKPKGSKVYQGSGDLSVQSDWSRHALQLDLKGTYNAFPDVKDANRPTMDAKLSFRGDISDNGTLNLELRERIDSQRPGSPDLTSAVKGRPLTYQTGASLGYTQKLGAIAITGTGVVDRYDFENAKTGSGLLVSQKDREYTQIGGRLRGAYEVTPGISPYVEIGADNRKYDLAIDAGGYRRSSTGMTAKLGTTFEITRTLTGDMSAGYGVRDYQDSRLKSLSGALVDASLVWQASPLTRVTLRAGSDFLETTQTGSAGAIGRRIGLIVTHDLLRNLQLGGNLDYSYASYSGVSRIEQTFISGLKLDYKLTPSLVFRTSYAFERAISSLPNNSTSAHVFLLGIRLQR